MGRYNNFSKAPVPQPSTTADVTHRHTVSQHSFFFLRTWVQFQTWLMCLWKPQRSPATSMPSMPSMLNANISNIHFYESLNCLWPLLASVGIHLSIIHLSLSMWGSCNCMCLVSKWEIYESLPLPGSQEPPGTPRSCRCRLHLYQLRIVQLID